MRKMMKKLTGAFLVFVLLTGCASFRGIDDDVPFYWITRKLPASKRMTHFNMNFAYPRYLFWIFSNKLDIKTYFTMEALRSKIHVKRIYFEYKGKEYTLLEDVTKNIRSRRLKLGKASNTILRSAFGKFELGESDEVLFIIEYAFDDGRLQSEGSIYEVTRIEYADFAQS